MSIIKGNYIVIPNRMEMTKADIKEWDSLYPNFKPYEVDSRDFSVYLYKPAMDKLQSLRTLFGKPLKLTSAWRNPKHNAAVGGKRNSDHTKIAGRDINASAYDIAITSQSMGRQLEKLAKEVGFNAIGRYPTSMFIHVSEREPKPSGRLYIWGRNYR